MESRIYRNDLLKVLLVMICEKEEKLPSIFFRFQTEFLGLVVVQKLQVGSGETLNLK